MTCFSILKSSLFAVAVGFIVNLTPLYASANSDPGATEEKKITHRELRKQEKEAVKVDSPIVIELFTTADCSACVFADRILYDTMKEKNVIALSCKITDLSELGSSDYRNLRTKGPEAAAKKQDGPMDPCVFRQWAYQVRVGRGETKINIPTFVFSGNDKIGADNTNYFTQVLNSYHYSYKNKTLEVFMRWKDKDTITVHLPEDPKAKGSKQSASVWIVRYKDMMVEKMDYGMNKGRVLRFSNIIQDIRHIGKWHKKMRMIDVDVPAPQGGKDKGGYVILVQEMMGDPVLAAGKLKDYPHPNDAKKPASAKNAEKERTVTPKAPANIPVRPELPSKE